MLYVQHKLSETSFFHLDGARCQLMELSGASKAHPALFSFSNPGSLCHWTSAFTQILTCMGPLPCWDVRAASTSLANLHQLPDSAVLKPWSALWTPAVKALFSSPIRKPDSHFHHFRSSTTQVFIWLQSQYPSLFSHHSIVLHGSSCPEWLFMPCTQLLSFKYCYCTGWKHI